MVQSPQPVADPNDAFRLERCQQRLGYQFRDLQLLEAALTHASGADHRLVVERAAGVSGRRDPRASSSASSCFTQFPDQLEGDLTKLKSIVVSRQTCAKISQALGLREFLVLGKGMTTHPAVPPSVLSDVLESLIAAIYLDGGMEPAREFMLTYFGPEIESAASGDTGGNYKSLLQQFAQREHGVTPTYHLLDEKGPGPQQVLQDVGPNRPPAICARLGTQQEGIGTARRPQRDLRTPRRSGAFPERRNA